jgi:NADH:ubiquinone oxidoreductase subunit E
MCESSQKPIVVRICTGTTCFVMGASELETLAEHLTPEQAAGVEIVGCHCLDHCKNRNYGRAPFVEINGQVYSEMTLPALLETIMRLKSAAGRSEDGAA